MSWKKLPNWLKGGLWGLGLSILARLLLEINNYSAINSILHFPNRFIPLNYDIVFLMDLVAYIFWVLVGSLLGWIVGKIKAKKAKNKY